MPPRPQSADALATVVAPSAPLAPVLPSPGQKSLEPRRAERLLAGQIQVLETISRGESLEHCLAALASMIETQAVDLVCTVLLMDADGRHVRHGAAPSLPQAFTAIVDGAEIGPCAGSCGTAAYRRAPVIVEDIATDPLWTNWRQHVLPLGLRACWSTPIFDERKTLLGTFALYYRHVGPPPSDHLRLVESATHLAGIAIGRSHQQSALRASSERLQLAAKAGNVGLFDLEVRTRQIYYSPQWKQQLGYADHELPNEIAAWRDRVHPDDVEATRAALWGSVDQPEGPRQFDFRIRHRDGKYRWFLTQVSVVRDATGHVTHVLGSNIDITDRKRHEEEVERLNRLYAALSHVNQLLVRTQSSAELFTNVTRIIVEQAGFAMAWIGWQQGDNIAPLAHFRGEGYVEQLRISTRADDPGGRGPTGIAFRENRTYVCNDFETDPAAAQWRAAARRRGFAANAVFPIRQLGSARGVLVVYASQPGAFLDREVALLEESAADIAFALEHLEEEQQRRDAERSLRESESRLRSLAMRLENIREQERTAIAREIHDVLAQELTRLKIDLVWLAKRAARLTVPEGAALAERIADATRQTDTAISTVQRIATELRPVILDSLGLAAAIEWQVEDFARRTGTHCRAEVPREELHIAREPATALFRILQESLTNVARHAAATEVHVELTRTDYAFRLCIRDDGRGVRQEEIDDPHSIGLVGMRERAQAFGGGFSIGRLPTRGTQIEVFIPFRP